MSVADEFKTVDLVLNSDAETRGVDAFALSLIKAEKQARRLVSYLVYQHAWCSPATVPRLRAEFEQSKKIYFDGVLRGWNAIYPKSIQQLVGPEYATLRALLTTATQHRNKIFHGQLTAHGLTRAELVAFVKEIRAWCTALGAGALAEVQYDGCGRNSFRKARNPSALVERYKMSLKDLAEYKQFIKSQLERQTGLTSGCTRRRRVARAPLPGAGEPKR